MPAWATVVISLGASTLVASSTLLSIWLTHGRQEHEAWRTRMIEASAAYLSDFYELFWKVGLLTRLNAQSSPREYEAVITDIENTWPSVAKTGALLELLWGRDTTTGAAAKDAFYKLKRSELAMKENNAGEARRSIELAERQIDLFVELAHEALRSHWRRSPKVLFSPNQDRPVAAK